MKPRLSAEDRALALAAISRLLLYPDPVQLGQVPVLRTAGESLPRAIGDPLLRLVAHLETTPLLTLQADYVATFDLRRRNCLYLTYHLNGDTRRRGIALWRFLDLYQQRGYAMADGELADFLPALLELVAETPSDDRAPLDLLLAHQAGIAVLRHSLEDDGSPYADAVSALEAVLPRPSAAALELARRLEADGPPAERVGLEPFSPVEPQQTRP